jgi:hypothetical protein
MQMCSETAYRKLYSKQNVSHRNTHYFILVNYVQKLHIQNYVKNSVLMEQMFKNIEGCYIKIHFFCLLAERQNKHCKAEGSLVT